MKAVRVIILGVLVTGISSLYAQDVITLKTGEEIKAKVEEISSSEVKYKRFDNLNGPTVVVAKTEVFAINYENGTREVINPVAADAPSKQNADYATWKGPHKKDFYTGIYLNPLGFLQVGPMLGVEFTFKRHLIIDAHLRFPQAGLLTGLIHDGTTDVAGIKGIGVGAHVKYFTGGQKGGFYVGPAIEYFKLSYHCPNAGEEWDENSIIVAANLGYKFQFSSGFYMRTGGFLGVYRQITNYLNGNEYSLSTTPFGILELSFGFAF
ncbi:MAG: hypothetical protein FWH36_02495 [Lentimicrobiaceae bacterium]|nr:hypothetical protein [Lentimicrobiaceae bacterium]